MSNGLMCRLTGGLIRDRTLQAGTSIAITNPAGDAGNPSIGITGAIATANGGTSVDIASAALPLGSGQITFPAIQNPSSNVNTLDDYEEGTWTPTLQFGGSNAGITYTTRWGVYVKIGGILFYEGRIDLSSKGAAGGAATIAALPFSELDGIGVGGLINYYLNMAAAVVSPMYYVIGTTMTLVYAGAGNIVAVDNTHFTNTTTLLWKGFYRTG